MCAIIVSTFYGSNYILWVGWRLTHIAVDGRPEPYNLFDSLRPVDLGEEG
jgi:hypothetical protein